MLSYPRLFNFSQLIGSLIVFRARKGVSPPFCIKSLTSVCEIPASRICPGDHSTIILILGLRPITDSAPFKTRSSCPSTSIFMTSTDCPSSMISSILTMGTLCLSDFARLVKPPFAPCSWGTNSVTLPGSSPAAASMTRMGANDQLISEFRRSSLTRCGLGSIAKTLAPGRPASLFAPRHVKYPKLAPTSTKVVASYKSISMRELSSASHCRYTII